MTKRQILNIIKGTLIVSIVGGIVWVKTREAEINRNWNSPEFQKTLREINSTKQNLFKDNDFNVNFRQPNNLNFRATLKNPFNEIIENSQLFLRLVLTYKKGTIKYVNKTIEEKKPKKAEVNYSSKEDWEIILELNGYMYKDGVILDKDGKFLENVKINGKTYSSGISKKDYYDMMQADDIYQKRKAKEEKIEEEKRNMLNAFRGNKNLVFDFNHNADFDLREDFKLYTKDSTDIKNMPTANLFKVENATLEVYLKASNTNGFYFDDKVKSIDITDKWNDFFVSPKNNIAKEYDISNAIKITIPNSLEQRASNSEIQKVTEEFKDKYDEIKGVKIDRSQIVFQPKGTNKIDANKILDDTKIFIKYSKNNTNEKLPNWNEKISSDFKKSIEKSIKDELIYFYNKTYPNLELDWLTTENGKANNNVFTKISCLVNTGNDITEISSYLFFNINENVMITYSRNKNNKAKWDRIFLETLETFDFKSKI